MKHVSFCGSRRRALIAVIGAAAFFACQTANAFAVTLVTEAVPTDQTISKDDASVIPCPAAVGADATAVCWTGEVLGGVAPADCISPTQTPPVPDPNDTTVGQCSVETLIPKDTGRVEAVISWEPVPGLGTPDLALAVYECVDTIESTLGMPTNIVNPVCTQVGFSSQNSISGLLQERVSFDAKATNSQQGKIITYEARTIPNDSGGDFATYTGCAGYIDNGANPCPNDAALDDQPPPPPPGPVPADTFLSCASTEPAAVGKRWFLGSGEIRESGTNKKIEQVALALRQRDGGKWSQGRINHRHFPSHQKLHSKRFRCIVFHDGSRSVDVAGTAWIQVDGQKKQKVCFTGHFQDVGKNGSGDFYNIRTLPFSRGTDLNDPKDDKCGTSTDFTPKPFGGPINKGDFRYITQRSDREDRADNCEYDEYDRDAARDNNNDYDWSRDR
jgi:hypothetical protein